jgi:predicted ATP-dependent endonuclease of OLD family
MRESMLHIKSAHIEGYKSILNADVEFSPGLNIIIGRNGAGKSNLLNVLEGLLIENPQILGTATVETIIETSNSEVARFKSCFLEGNVELIAEKERINFINSNGTLVFAKQSPSKRATTNGNAELILIPHSIPQSIPFLDRRLDLTVSRMHMKVDELWSILIDPDKPYFVRSMAAELFFRVGNEDNDFEAGKDEMFALKRWASEIIERLDSPLAELTSIQGMRLSESVLARPATNGHSVTLLNVSFEYKVANQWLTFDQLSDGTKRMVYISFAMMAPRSTFPTLSGINHKTEKIQQQSITFLEEPELGIHPHQLHLLLIFLKEQAKTQQIIITTHSPQVLDILDKDELDKIIIASYDAEKGSQFTHLSEAKKEKALAYMGDMLLSDYWRFSDLEARPVLS